MICLFVNKTTTSIAFRVLTFSSESDKNREIDVAGTPVWNARTGSLLKITLLQPEDIRYVRKPKWICLESVEENQQNIGMRNYRSKYQDEKHWRTSVEEDKIHHVL
jgi:hypothetical protein